MRKWILRADPSGVDPQRHLLFISGDKKDAQKIIKKFGKLCGRPSLVDESEGYDLSLPLHHPDEQILKKLEEFLNSMVPATKPAPEPAAIPKQREAEPPIKTQDAQEPLPVPMENPQATPQEEVPSTHQEPSMAFVVPEPVGSLTPQSSAPSPEQKLPPLSSDSPEETLNPLQTFEFLSIGPYNRFAHAAAISVAGAPGGMYNPLFLHGPPGSGKSHLAQSLAQEFTKTLGEKSVILTSGWRLSIFASSSSDSIRGAWLEEGVQHLKVLIIDDIHLLALTENAQGFIGKMIASFLERDRQLIVTAVYSPRALETLSQRLKISFSSGQAAAVEMKASPPAIQLDILKEFLNTKNIELSEDESKLFLEKIALAPLENYRWTNRLMRLISLGISLNQNPKIGDLIPPLFDLGKIEAEKALPEKADLARARDFHFPKVKDEALPIIWFSPNGQDSLVSWTQMRFFQSMGDMGISRAYRNLPTQFYDPTQPLGLPFQIGEICQRLGPRAAVFVGPPPQTTLGEREMEWIHATSHVLGSMGIPSAWIPYRELKVDGSYLRAHLDLMS